MKYHKWGISLNQFIGIVLIILYTGRGFTQPLHISTLEQAIGKIDNSRNDSELVVIASHWHRSLVYKNNAYGDSVIRHALSRLDDKHGINFFKLLHLQAIHFDLKGNDSMALMANKRCIKRFRENNDSVLMAACLLNIGRSFKAIGVLDSGLEYTLRAYEINKKIDSNEAAKCAVNIWSNLTSVGQKEKAIHYLRKSLSLATDSSIKGSILLNLGINKYYTNQLDSALNFYLKALSYNNRLISAHTGLGIIYRKRKLYDSCFSQYERALKMSKKTATQRGINVHYNNIGKVLINLGKHRLARNYLDTAFQLCIKDSNEFAASTAFNIALNYMSLNQQDSSEMYSEIHAAINGRVIEKISKSKAYQVEVKYQTAQKEQRIALLEKEQGLKSSQLKQKNQLLIGGSISTVVVSLLALLAVYNQRKRQRLQKALLITEKEHMKKELQLEVVNSEIRAQETERQRISQELHDGVSTSMAALRWSINKEMPDNENAGKLYSQFEEITQELRSLSHGLHSPRLTDQPLITSLNSYLSRFEGSGLRIDLHLPKEGLPNFEEELALTLYRMVQEITNNCIKHAEATELSFSFELGEEKIRLTATDNGKGFDAGIQTSGTGLNNMERRAKALGGSFTLSPELGIGTTIYVSLPL